MRSKIVVGVVAAVAAMLVTVPAAGAAPADATDGARLELVTSGLSTTVDIAAPPGDDRLFVVEKVGRIRIIKNGSLLAAPFLDLTGVVDASSGERGLLGLAFDADYATNGRFYVNYTAVAGGGDTVVARHTVSSSDPNRANKTGTTLLTQNQPFSNHNGGDVAFGPDGYVYASIGDGGSGGDPQENGQNKNNILGTIVRIDPDDGAAAPGNPFIGKPGDDRIWAYGLRNPWRFDFDAVTGDIILGDVGQNAWEEIDRIPAGRGGLNFGWDEMEGNHCFEPSSGCNPSGKVPPIHEYAHGADPCSGSVTGGIVYRGNDLPWLRGTYFYADYCKSFLKSFRINAKGKAVEHQTWTSALGAPGNILTFGEDGFGEMYLASGGSVYKLVPDGPAACDFNGDGRSDLAVGVPREDHGGTKDAGVVQVFDGASSGLLDLAGDMTLRVGGNLPGTPGRGDRFGQEIACGDFDRDGYVDLAIGTPRRDVAGRPNAGAVHVVYGSPGGLAPGTNEVWHQGVEGIPGQPRRGDQFGSTLASGDFDRDGYKDLAIGVPSRRVAGVPDAGAVAVLYGGSGGLSADRAHMIHREKKGIQGSAGSDDSLGVDLVAADFDGDGHSDLAMGVFDDGPAGGGAVHVVHGRNSGLGKRDAIVERSGSGAPIGLGLAAGHLDDDGFDDLIVGRFGVEVLAIFGEVGGLGSRDRRFVPGNGLPSLNDTSFFGLENAVADFNGDGIDDLAIGNRTDTIGGDASAGSVLVLYSGVNGPVAASAELWHRDVAGVRGRAKPADLFGTALRGLDHNGDGRDELAIGLTGGPGEVTVLRGRRAGFNAKGDLRLRQGFRGAGGKAERGDRFGQAL